MTLTRIATLFLATFLLQNGAHAADPELKIATLLGQATPPAGVVFEVASGRENALQWALPLIQDYTRRLRGRFPDLDIAVVSHGKEEFSLLDANRDKYQEVHKAVVQLTSDAKVPIHVCGTHAAWYDKSAEDFPDYIDVAPVGPTQIRDYQNLGYTLITLKQPKN